MKKTYIAPITGTNELEAVQVLCVSGGPLGVSVPFNTGAPGDDWTAD